MSKYIHIRKEKLIHYSVATKSIETQFPFTWFLNNPGTKPIITLPRTTCGLPLLRGEIAKQFGMSKIEKLTALAYLAEYLKTVQEELDDDWTSYNIVIGNKGSLITPLNLLKIQIEGAVTIPNGNALDDETQDEWMAPFLLCVYRYSKATNMDYRAILVKRMSEYIKTMGEYSTITSQLDRYQNWTNDRNYCKLVAAIDMFLEKFSKSRYSILKMGTMGSRMRDCATLTSLTHLAIMMDVEETDDVLDWIYVPKVSDELLAMMSEGDEIERSKMDSYFPYQIDLYLVTRSSYSAIASPYSFILIHCISTLLGSERSKNARVISEMNLAGIILNAKIAAFAHAYTRMLEKGFTKQGDLAQFKEEQARIAEAENSIRGIQLSTGMPEHDATGADWLEYVTSHKYGLPKVITDWVEDQKSRLKDVRPGTIGELIKTQF